MQVVILAAAIHILRWYVAELLDAEHQTNTIAASGNSARLFEGQQIIQTSRQIHAFLPCKSCILESAELHFLWRSNCPPQPSLLYGWSYHTKCLHPNHCRMSVTLHDIVHYLSNAQDAPRVSDLQGFLKFLAFSKVQNVLQGQHTLTFHT